MNAVVEDSMLTDDGVLDMTKLMDLAEIFKVSDPQTRPAVLCNTM